MQTKKFKFHYSWVVCLGCAVIYFSTVGMGCNDFSTYSPFIMKAREFSKTRMSAITSARALVQTLGIGLTGAFYKKVPLREGMGAAGLVAGAGYVVYGLAKSFPAYLAGSALLGLGYGLGSMVPISQVLDRWFYKDKTLAVSLVSSASGLATIGIPSLITFVIGRAGMEKAFFLQALSMALLSVFSFAVIRNDPADLSMAPYGEGEETEAAEELKETGKKGSLSSSWWILLCVMVALSTSYNAAGFSHLSLLFTTEGYAPETVALALSSAGGMLMIGKFVFGAMSVRLSLRVTSLIFGILCILSTFGLCFSGIGTGYMMAMAGLFGFSITVISIGVVAWAGEWAGRKERAGKVRLFQLVYSLGWFATGLLPGIMADAAGGSYVPFYFLSGILCIGAVVAVEVTYRKLEKTGEKS